MNAHASEVLPPATTAIAEYTATEAALADLTERYAGAQFQVTTTAGLNLAKAARAELRDHRVNLEKMRKQIKAPALERCNMIDTEAKRITRVLESLEEPIDAQIKAEETRKENERLARIQAEQARVDKLNQKILEIRDNAARAIGLPSSRIKALIEGLQANEPDPAVFQEFTEQANVARLDTIEKLGEMHNAQVAQEAEQLRIQQERADFEKQKEAEAARLREEEERLQREREERQRQDDERRRADDEKAQAERERLAAEENERRRIQREQDESDRLERERIENEERARRAEQQRIEDQKRADDAAKLEAERATLESQRQAERAAKEADEIEKATLVDAAGAALLLLVELGQDAHLTTRKLSAALDRYIVASRNQVQS